MYRDLSLYYDLNSDKRRMHLYYILVLRPLIKIGGKDGGEETSGSEIIFMAKNN